MSPSFFFPQRSIIHALCLLALCMTIGACSGLHEQEQLYPPPATLSQAPSLRQDFIQEFLQGRWYSANTLFLQTQENYLRQDNFCSVAQTYILAYKLHAYLGMNYPHLLDKATDFAQQGLNCGSVLFTPEGQPEQNEQDKRFHLLLQTKDWLAVLTYIKTLQDPLTISVYGRRATVEVEELDTKWAKTFLDIAHTVDSRQGWTLFLIKDWQLYLSLETNLQRQLWIKKRIATLSDLVEPCNQPIIGS